MFIFVKVKCKITKMENSNKIKSKLGTIINRIVSIDGSVEKLNIIIEAIKDAKSNNETSCEVDLVANNDMIMYLKEIDYVATISGTSTAIAWS